MKEFKSAEDFRRSIERNSVALYQLQDFFQFEVGSAKRDLTAPLYGGARFPVSAKVGNRLFVNFSMDIAIGEVIEKPLEIRIGNEWIKKIGIEPVHYRMISAEQQFAEKLHAYTFPIGNNSRVKDLIDLIILIKEGDIDNERLKTSIIKIFNVRASHVLPSLLEKPPSDWEIPYGIYAKECGLKQSIHDAYEILNHFYLKHLYGSSDTFNAPSKAVQNIELHE